MTMTSDKMNSVYNRAFFDTETKEALQAAETIVPLLLQLFQPESVIDVGCATGAWLSVFKANNVSQILGLDGDYVDRSRLLIPPENFRSVDLSQQFKVEERFDLAICLEVAEHLPAARAKDFIDTISQLAPIVVFSAALPGQDGTHPINEQWPNYWYNFFIQNGYLLFDPLRHQILHDPRVVYYYKQNLFVYIKKELVEANPLYAALPQIKSFDSLDTLLFVSAPILRQHLEVGFTATLKKLPALFKAAVLRAWRKF